MDEHGNIRELAVDEVLRPGEIDVTRYEKGLSLMSRKARADYYRAIRQGLSLDGALACARATERKVMAR